MSRLISTALAAVVLGSGMAAVAPAAHAQVLAPLCEVDADLWHADAAVHGYRGRICYPDGTFHPQSATIQRRSGTSWINVTATKVGYVRYTCVGSATRTYRLKELPGLQITVPCS